MKRGTWVGLTLGLLLVGRLAMAQDPLEVGPDIYKLVFQNDRVRVMEITFKPGDKIALHSHPDHFVYVLSGGTLALSSPDGTKKEFVGKPGDVVWISAESHAAENIGTTEFKGVVVELKEPAAAPAASPDSAKPSTN